MMEKAAIADGPAPPLAPSRRKRTWLAKAAFAAGVICLASLYYKPGWHPRTPWTPHRCHGRESPYGVFPERGDPFKVMPCTNVTLPPALDDAHPERSRAKLFDANPDHWS